MNTKILLLTISLLSFTPAKGFWWFFWRQQDLPATNFVLSHLAKCYKHSNDSVSAEVFTKTAKFNIQTETEGVDIHTLVTIRGQEAKNMANAHDKKIIRHFIGNELTDPFSTCEITYEYEKGCTDINSIKSSEYNCITSLPTEEFKRRLKKWQS